MAYFKINNIDYSYNDSISNNNKNVNVSLNISKGKSEMKVSKFISWYNFIHTYMY